jgi:hypothetical protein
MKLLLAVVMSTFAFSSFASIKFLTCTVGETKMIVKVAGPEAYNKGTTAKFQSINDKGTVSIAARYNGTSTRMKPGASGNYSLDILLKVTSLKDPTIKNEAASLTFSATFPSSQTVIFSRSNVNVNDDSNDEQFTVPVTCVPKA